MWKPVLAFTAFMIFLSGVGLMAGSQVFEPLEGMLSASEQPAASAASAAAPPALGMDEQQYKKTRLAFNSFDLAGGLTRYDWETIPTHNTYFFVFLLSCIGVLQMVKISRS